MAKAVPAFLIAGVAFLAGAGPARADDPLLPPAGANVHCPVRPERKALAAHFLDHEGRRVYFCCADCPAAFRAEPAKFASALPPPRPAPPVAAPAPRHWLWNLAGRLHPAVVHFPIALILLAGLFEVYRLRKRMPVPTDAGIVCLALGAAGAVGSAVSGWSYAEGEAFGGRAAEILETHRNLGIATAVLAAGAAVLAVALRRGAGRAPAAGYGALLLGAAACVGASGHYGGMLVHGESYLASAFAPPAPAAPSAAAWAPGQPVDFARHVEPLFRQACFECHGPEKQKGGLRLDVGGLAFKGGLAGPALVRGKAAESLLVRRVLGEGGTDRMPLKKPPLSDAQIALLRAWIDQGATWPGAEAPTDGRVSTHWAYRKPVRPPVPAVGTGFNLRPAAGSGPEVPPTAHLKPAPGGNSHSQLPLRNSIDAFVRARLEKEGLEPSPEAGKETLIRRVSLDLIGLPPTPEEVDAFAADGSPDAYEKLVDRLLASPHYGERWARPWLDLARYADSHGYEKDNPRVHWKYRDWVIDALNKDLPYDQFTIEQIAGDMLAPSGAEGLPDATEAQKIATGFHRNTMINEEGGVDGDEAHWLALVDRVGTTASVWLGSTLACAQCHNHKFDPFTQKEFYQLLAFFTHVELGTRPNGLVFVHHESAMDLPTPEQAAKRKELNAAIAEQDRILNTQTPELDAAQAQWEKDLEAGRTRWTTLRPAALTAGGSVLGAEDDGSITASGSIPERDTYEVTARTDVQGITGVRLEVRVHPSLPHTGPGRDANGDFLLTGFEVETCPAPPPGADAAAAGPWTRVELKRAAADLTRPGTDVANLLKNPPPAAGWTTELLTARSDQQAIFVTAQPAGHAGGTLVRVRLKQEGERPRRVLGRFRLSVTSGAEPPNTISLAHLWPLLDVAPDQRTPAQKAELSRHYRAVAPALKEPREKVAKLRGELNGLGIATAMTLQERAASERPSTELRVRGNFLLKGEKVYADVPAVLHPLPRHVMPNRLGLARWLVDRENPLAARVAVNRFWETIFGRGLVETAEDFGTQGSPPTHPELLDWLAVEFMEPTVSSDVSGTPPGVGTRHGASPDWSMKAIHRLIVTSATYRQSSRATPLLLEKDPYNKLLARGPRFRMEAEMVRDVALAVSGDLSRKIGGPSVYPPQPDGIWNIPYSGDVWTTSTGEDRFRRGLYTFLRRTAPYPQYTMFDATSRESCTVRRVRTNTPLQALTTLNDPAYFDAARGLARRMMLKKEAGDPRAKAEYGFRCCVARRPAAAELDRLAAYFEQERGAFRKDAAGAAKVVKGVIEPPKELDVPELAAWTMVANVLLNLDEAITKE